MTRRVTISLPDDVAAVLEALPPGHVSAYVAETIRGRVAADDMRALPAKAGMRNIPPYDPAGAVAKAAEARAKITDEVLEPRSPRPPAATSPTSGPSSRPGGRSMRARRRSGPRGP